VVIDKQVVEQNPLNKQIILMKNLVDELANQAIKTLQELINSFTDPNLRARQQKILD
jgi:hypothetical protein